MIRHIAKLFYIPIVYIILTAIWIQSGFILNITHSLPVGIYRYVDKTPEKGDVVIFCLDNDKMIALANDRQYLHRGHCPGELTPLMKIVYGLPGDTITFDSHNNIILNNIKLNNSKPQKKDSKERVMPQSDLNEGTIPKGKVLLLALNQSTSFDARYWGLQPIENLKVVKPFWVSSTGEFK